jgi:hypothetical protein
VQFINGLFGADHPINSVVEYPTTEYISENLKKHLLDILIVVNKTYTYHLEAQIKDDKNMAVRMFEYGHAVGFHNKKIQENVIHIKFPEARVIYWETTKKTPDQETLVLEFPDGTTHKYQVKTFKYLSHSIKELEEERMVILLPFYLLKLRKRVIAAKTGEKRAKLAVELKDIIEKMMQSLESSEKRGLITTEDVRLISDHIDRLLSELYKNRYEEFKEADEMLQGALKTYSEIAAEQARLDERKLWQEARQKEQETWQKEQETWQKEQETWQRERKQMIENLTAMGMDKQNIAHAMNLSVDDVVKLSLKKDDETTSARD